MDRFTYFPANAEYGVYSARRLPKGVDASALNIAESGGDIVAAKPNYAGIPLDFFGGVLAPHTPEVQRWTYTVPLKRRAVLQHAFVSATRRALGAPNLTRAVISITRAKSGGGFEVAFAYGFIDAVGDQVKDNFNSGYIDLFEGDRLFAITEDVSAGGTVDYVLAAAVIEFDSGINYNPAQAASLQASFTGSIPARATFGTGKTAGFLTGDWLKQFTG